MCALSARDGDNGGVQAEFLTKLYADENIERNTV